MLNVKTSKDKFKGMTVINKTSRKSSVYKQWTVAIIANLTTLTYGIQSGWISAVGNVLRSDQSPTGRPLTDTEIGWLGGIPSVAGLFSAIWFIYLCDKIGRKLCIIISASLGAVCWIIKICPSSIETLLIARICHGISGVVVYGVVPIYVREISQSNIRGVLGFILAFNQYFGVFVMYAMGGYLDYYLMHWILLVISVTNIVLMAISPESPAFLVKMGKNQEAMTVIASLRSVDVNDKIVKEEFQSIERESDNINTQPNMTYGEIFKNKAWRRGFIYMILLMIAHGISGGYTIIVYASTILATCGITLSPELQSLSIPIFMIIGSLTSMSCVDRVGRRPLLGIAFGMSVISFITIGVILLIVPWGYYVPGWLTILALAAAVFAYAGAISPMPFVIMPEMFNFQIRAKLMAFLGTLGWFGSVAQMFIYSVVAAYLGEHATFFVYAVTNLLGLFVVIFLLPETKGKSVEEIETMLKGEEK